MTGPRDCRRLRLPRCASKRRALRSTARLPCGARRLVTVRGSVPEARRTCRDACSHLIEHNGEDLRNRSFLDRKAALARLLRLLNEHIADGGPTVFAHPCRLGAEASSQSGSTAPIDPVHVRSDQGPQSRHHRGAAGGQREIGRDDLGSVPSLSALMSGLRPPPIFQLRAIFPPSGCLIALASLRCVRFCAVTRLARDLGVPLSMPLGDWGPVSASRFRPQQRNRKLPSR